MLFWSSYYAIFDSFCANIVLWLKRLNFGETPYYNLYYMFVSNRNKVEIPTSSSLHLMLFHLSGHLAYYARCRIIRPYLSSQIAYSRIHKHELSVRIWTNSSPPSKQRLVISHVL